MMAINFLNLAILKGTGGLAKECPETGNLAALYRV